MPDEIKELQEQMAKFQATLSEQKQENDSLKAENAELKKEFGTLKADKDKLEADSKAEKVKVARDKVTAVFEAAVKSEVITPAQRTAFFKMLGVDDDDKVLSIEEDDVKALLPEGAQQMFKAETGNGTSQYDGDSPDDALTTKAYEIQNASGGNMSFTAAAEQALRTNPALAQAYRDQNGEMH